MRITTPPQQPHALALIVISDGLSMPPSIGVRDRTALHTLITDGDLG
jgi:hypothetical protein